MLDSPLVSVIVVNWNTRALLGACLASVRATMTTLPYEIIVVDNASSDDSVTWLRQHEPTVQLIANQENVGFARANNQALTTCRGEFALLLNSDAQLVSDCATRLVETMRQEPRAAAVAPMLLNPDGSYQSGPNDALSVLNQSLLAFGLARFFRSGYYPGHDQRAPRGAYAWVAGTCLLMRRTAWEEFGMLDKDFFMYTEEVDWCWRARRAGWQIWYEPHAQAIHLGGGSSRQVSGKMRAALYQSKLLFFKKHYPGWKTVTLRAMFLFSAFIKIALYDSGARLLRAQAQSWHERASSFRLVFDAVKTVSA